jgi:anti-sigma factor RsiW
MRCVDCLPLIEEYFDGEADARTAEQVGAHLSNCADCAAALDALRFEQELYARYDRRLEVTPALWAAVSARVARGPQPTLDEDARPFMTRLRAALAATLGALALRPALASSLALLLIGVAAGTLWLTRVRPAAPRGESAKNEPDKAANVNPPSEPVVNQGDGGSVESPNSSATSGGPTVAGAASPKSSPESVKRGGESRHATPTVETAETLENLLAYTPPATGAGVVVIKDDDRESTQASPVAVDIPDAGKGVVTTEARLANPEQKEVARHVERAQMLLRSVKNARPAEGGSVNLAYEKTSARKLLAANATLQLDADARGDRETKQVLDRIEPFLLDIANLGERPSREEVRSLKERVEKNEIIAALQVY